MVKMTKSKTFQAYLPNCHRTYSCIHCRAHLANHDELISKSFQGSQGRAYLFNSVVNVGCGPAEERVLLTGLHAVADIYCENCKTTLGWKYVCLLVIVVRFCKVLLVSIWCWGISVSDSGDEVFGSLYSPPPLCMSD
ncbi:protein yippee-like 1 isoform X1 [Rhincodon typus]|uniref:protein yippee-like 1 isoform X1 n=1 Tax=Rhincodon typus TaxID=259920 RepID=UPI00202FA858|nr:protein yippee-like 1 isoform X1 [Rhincodon typus]XP_048467436.1 protein yippee-like 1 isoform X1 [Rhincodon typus]XP_048467437.1 protein yippee-like 1 isoform X1 [Rhincodon typus]XP_048467438.1 protein yippee-like 1 isoform X1 [Rhincodon typus]